MKESVSQDASASDVIARPLADAQAIEAARDFFRLAAAHLDGAPTDQSIALALVAAALAHQRITSIEHGRDVEEWAGRIVAEAHAIMGGR